MASRLVTRHYDRALAPAGVTVNDYAILARLADEGPLPVGALAARLAMDRSTLSRELAPLISAGLVATTPDANDGRRRLLSLSTAGSACVADARPLWATAQAELVDDFGRSRADALVGELQALVGAGA
jgi:DNA-binding MarR family transcriptional regulator